MRNNDLPMGMLSPREIEAYEHVKQQVEFYGSHDVTGCPRNCRAMCQYRLEIKALKERGIEVPE